MANHMIDILYSTHPLSLWRIPWIVMERGMGVLDGVELLLAMLMNRPDVL